MLQLITVVQLEGHELSYLRAIGVIILSAVLKRRMILADKSKSLFISKYVYYQPAWLFFWLILLFSISHELRFAFYEVFMFIPLIFLNPPCRTPLHGVGNFSPSYTLELLTPWFRFLQLQNSLRIRIWMTTKRLSWGLYKRVERRSWRPWTMS